MKQHAGLGLGLGLGVVVVLAVASCAQGSSDAIGDDGAGGGDGTGGAGNVTTGNPTSTSNTTSSTSNTSTSSNTSTTNSTSVTSSTNTSSTVGPTTAATSTSSGGCQQFIEVDCGDGTCVSIIFECDGANDCSNGADEDPLICGTASTTSSSTGSGGTWSCDPLYYGGFDGCDCGCGEVDPDCLDSSSLSCDYCGETGACSTDSTCSDINPNDNSQCL